MKKKLLLLAIAYLVFKVLLVFPVYLNTYAEEACFCPSCGAQAAGNYCYVCGTPLPTLGEDEAALSMKFTYEGNRLLARYDVDVYVDGSCIGTVKQKETLEKTMVVKKGIREITLQKGEDVKASILVDALHNAQYSCTLKARVGSLELKDVCNSSPVSETEEVAYRINKDYGQCGDVDYEYLCRFPELYRDNRLHVGGVVVATSENNLGVMKVIVKDQKNKLWIVKYDRQRGEPRLLVHDSVDVYGYCKGITTYQSSVESFLNLPTIHLEYLKLR